MKKGKSKDVLYLPVDALFHLMALMPFRVLYMISDVIYFWVYNVVGYRRKIVHKNLKESFPEKNEEEICRIERRFYHFFADYFVETIKLLHVSDDEIRRRLVFHDVDIIDRYLDEGRSILIYAAHYANWEWLPSVTLWSRHDFTEKVFGSVYRPLNNDWFNSLFLHLRQRFYTHCFAKRTVFRDLLRLRNEKKQAIIGFMSDQHPSVTESGHVIRFLNHDTAIITGSELLARKLNYVVLYFEPHKLSRGHYECYIREIAPNPGEKPMYSISDEYARRLETQIKEDPSIWLWTHNRWKHKVKLNAESGE